MAHRVTVFRRADGDYGWRRKAENGAIVATAGEGYQSKRRAEEAAHKVNDGPGIEFDEEPEPGHNED